MNARRKTVLVFVDWYLPGSLAGGPIRSIASLVEFLGDEIEFKIVTGDRDLHQPPYKDVRINEWQQVGKARVFYASPRRMSLRWLRHLLCHETYDCLYLNSFFSYRYTLKVMALRFLNLIPRKGLIVAPRGQFSSGALSLKRFKKACFLFLARTLGLFRGVIFQASSSREAEQIFKVFQENRISIASVPVVVVASDLLVARSQDPARTPAASRAPKQRGRLRILFLGRVARMKNLEFALTVLGGLRGDITFEIVGPAEDAAYWQACQDRIATLPAHVKVSYRGAVDHAEVHSIMEGHDVFFLPTLGENFGHVILEALLSGLPVIISDQTPWLGLQAHGVGWDLPLDDPDAFVRALQACVDMDGEAFAQFSGRARAHGERTGSTDAMIKQNQQLFRIASTEEVNALP